MKKIYFDSAASTIIDDRVIDAMMTSMKEDFANPSANHSFGQEGKSKIETARKNIAKALHVQSNEIIFTSCGTEANNLIIRSCIEDLGIKRIVTSILEHKCISETIHDLERKHPDLEVVLVPLKNKKAELDFDALEEILKDEKPTLVTLMHANNEVGNLIDLNFVGNLCKKYQALFHTDTVQTMGHYDLDFSKIPVDFASCSAHKFHGPKGAGFAYIKKATGLKGIITGGGQERNMRSGTENIYGIVGLDKSFSLALQELEERKNAIEELKKYTIEELKKYFPDVKINGFGEDFEKSSYTLVSATFPFSNPMLGFQLDMEGVVVSGGSACASGAAKPSKTMQAIYSIEELNHSTTLRISFSHYNTKQEVDELVKALLKTATETSVH